MTLLWAARGGSILRGTSMRNNLDPPYLHDPLVGIAAVMRFTSLSRTSVYRLIARGKFPKAIELMPGSRRVAWRESEVARWVSAPSAWRPEAAM